MVVETFGVVTLLLALIGLVRGPVFGLYVVLILSLFGSTAALSLPALGGSSIQVMYFFIPFFILASIFRRGNIERSFEALTFPGAPFWLFALSVYVLLSAILFPNIFRGMTDIFVVSRDAGIATKPLAFTGGNITQSGYFMLEFVYFIVLMGILRGRQHHLVSALFLVGTLNIAFAFLDLITYATHTSFILDFFRNASYSFLTDAEIFGLKRITGLFPEASTFGTVTLAFFGFFVQLWLRGYRVKASGPLAGVSFALLALSTSSSVYAVLAVLIALIYVQCAGLLFLGRAHPKHLVIAIFCPAALIVGLLGLTFVPTVLETLQFYIDKTLVSKLDSQSGVERMAWNIQAWRNFLDTGGFGAGAGSVRASSWLFGVLGSLGLIGALFYGLFLAKVFQPALRFFAPRGVDPVPQAALFGCLAVLLVALLIAPGFSLRIHFLTMAALAVSLSWAAVAGGRPVVLGARAA